MSGAESGKSEGFEYTIGDTVVLNTGVDYPKSAQFEMVFDKYEGVPLNIISVDKAVCYSPLKSTERTVEFSIEEDGTLVGTTNDVILGVSQISLTLTTELGEIGVEINFDISSVFTFDISGKYRENSSDPWSSFSGSSIQKGAVLQDILPGPVSEAEIEFVAKDKDGNYFDLATMDFDAEYEPNQGFNISVSRVSGNWKVKANVHSYSGKTSYVNWFYKDIQIVRVETD